jgi:hypothetical protein
MVTGDVIEKNERGFSAPLQTNLKFEDASGYVTAAR